MTLNADYALCFKIRASLGAHHHHENMNEDRPIAEMWPTDSIFWQYKVYANIRESSLEKGRQTTVG